MKIVALKHVEMIIDYTTDGTDFQYNDNHGILVRCIDCHWYASDRGKCLNYRSQLNGEVVAIDYCSRGEKS